MILTQNPESVFKEYQEEFRAVIEPRLLGYLISNKKPLLKAQKLKERLEGPGVWVPCKGIRKINTSRHNKYQAIMEGRIGKSGEPEYLAKIFTILNDTTSGKRLIYVFGDGSLIKILPSFIKEYASEEDIIRNLPFKPSLEILETEDWCNCKMPLGDGRIGIGHWEKNLLELHHIYTEDPITEPLPEIILSDKEKEINQAWEEYDRLKNPDSLIYENEIVHLTT